MADDRDREDRGFKVNDRRKFTAEGQLREGAEDPPAEAAAPPVGAAPGARPQAPAAPVPQAPAAPVPQAPAAPVPQAPAAPAPRAPAPRAPAAVPSPVAKAADAPRVIPVSSARPIFPGAMRTGPSSSFAGHRPGSSTGSAPPPAPTAEEVAEHDQAAHAQYHGESPQDGAAIDFPQFVLATARLAAMFLGDIPSPQSGRPELNLGAAKQQIDLLGLLQEKTRGNLQKEEEQLMQALLTELRLRFVEVRKQSSGKRGG